jgi:hypothetical protein
MASSSAAHTNPLIGHAISEKLSKNNHPLWKTQVLPIIRGARLEGFLTGSSKEPEEFIVTKEGDKEVNNINPAHEAWVALDQQVLGFLLSSLSREVLQQVMTCKTAAAAWKTIENSFGSQTRARTVNVRIAYVNKMCALGDEMASAGKPLDDEELVSYILAGLDIEYNSVVSATVARVEPITVNELYGQLLSFKSRQILLQGSNGAVPSTNAAMRGRGGFGRGRGNSHGRNGGRGGRGGPPNNYNNGGRGGHPNTGKKPICQVCDKEGHIAKQCWYRFDESYGSN